MIGFISGVKLLFKLQIFNKNKDTEDISEIIKRIKKSQDESLKECFICKYKPFILKCVSQFVGKYVETENSDEFSIGLLAFNEAIDTFEPRHNRNFFNFSEQVIKRRLINYDKVNRNKNNLMTFSCLESKEGDFENKYLGTDYVNYFSQFETKDQMNRYEKELMDYGISFDELIIKGPKHKDAREKLIEVGIILAENAGLYKSLACKKNIPLSDLMKLVTVSQRTIERNRKFIIAVCIAHSGEYDILKEYVKGHGKGGEKYE